MPAALLHRDIQQPGKASGLAGVLMQSLAPKQRNLSDHSGDLIPDATSAECLACGIDLLAHVRSWPLAHRPEL